MFCKSNPSQALSSPRGPHRASTPNAATSVGTTKGSISKRSVSVRPANSKRASTQATGKPNSKAATHVTPACTTDHTKRQRK